jgi:hypothetical protein
MSVHAAADARRPAADPIIVNRGEFIDALHLLRKGHVMVQVGESDLGWAIDGSLVRYSVGALRRYQLIQEFHNPEGFPGVRYFRLSTHGRAFADRAWLRWRQLPLRRRLWVRLVG